MSTSNKKIRWFLSLAAFGMLAGAALMFILARSRSANSITNNLLPESNVLMSLSNVRQSSTKNGKLQWELKAARARLLGGGKAMELDKPEVGFYTADGTKVLLRADSGKLNLKTNDIIVKGHVSIDNSRYRLTTDLVAYEHENRLLDCNRPVTIIGQGIRLDAGAMSYDLKANKALFKGQVKGVLSETPIM